SGEAAWQLPELSTGPLRQRLTLGGGWSAALPRNRYSTPSNMNLITADGTPAFVIDFNTPDTAASSIRDFSAYAADRIVVTEGLSLDLGVRMELSRGSVS